MSWTVPHTYSPGELVTAAMLNSIPYALLWDSVDAGVTLPTASITTPTLDQTFRQLLIVGYVRVTDATREFISVRFNGDTGANYSYQELYASNTTTTAVAVGGGTAAAVFLVPGTAAPANEFGACALEIPSYQGTSNHKAFTARFMMRNTATAADLFSGMVGGLWASNAAISTVTFLDSTGGNIASGSRFSIYGVAG